MSHTLTTGERSYRDVDGGLACYFRLKTDQSGQIGKVKQNPYTMYNFGTDWKEI
jgi:hypothetical protein